MKIFRNIPFVIWMYHSLRYLNASKKEILDAQATGDIEKEKAGIIKATSTWSKKIIEHYNIDLRIEGKENIPEGGVLFVSNHEGYADIIVFCAAVDNKQIGFVAKDNLEKVPLYGRWILRIRSLLLGREDTRGAVKVFNEGIKNLKQGFSLVIFPEGTRSRSDNMGTFKRGSLRLATKAEVPVVPVTVSGTWKLWEAQGYMNKNAGPIRMYFHPPIQTKGMTKLEANELSEQVEQIVRGKLEEWNGDI